jgi:hypothetical protein
MRFRRILCFVPVEEDEMGVVHSMDADLTTAVVDLGAGLMPVLIRSPISDVEKTLSDGSWVVGDSPVGEVHIAKDAVKYLQVGKREVNLAASGSNSYVNEMLGV